MKKTDKRAWSFPEVYSYPPFWTLQSNPAEREKQCALWSNLICAFSKFHNITEFELIGALETPLFKNAKLGRQLSENDLVLILDYLVEKGNAQWLSEKKGRVRIIWRTYKQWADMIYKWASDNGQVGTVFTVHELMEDHPDAPCHKMNVEMLTDVIKSMQAEGRANYMQNQMLDECGVKFL